MTRHLGTGLRMNELPQGPAAYELRSVGALRCHTARREFHMQLLLCEVESDRFMRTWVPLSRPPLLTQGSQWRNRQATRVRREDRVIRPNFGGGIEQLPAPHRPGHQALGIGGWLDPTLPHRTGLWRFQSAMGFLGWRGVGADDCWRAPPHLAAALRPFWLSGK